MKRSCLKFTGLLSCLIILATLPVLAQNQINKGPLRDFVGNLNAKLDAKKVDLDKPFSVTLEGYLTKEGKFDPKRSRFTKREGDEKMTAVAKDAIEAIGDSTIFSYLKKLGTDKVLVTLSQDEKIVSFIITGEQSTAEKAKTLVSGFNSLVHLAQLNTKEDADVQTLLKAITFKAEGKNFLINLALPKEEAHRMLKTELQKAKEKSYSS